VLRQTFLFGNLLYQALTLPKVLIRGFWIRMWGGWGDNFAHSEELSEAKRIWNMMCFSISQIFLISSCYDWFTDHFAQRKMGNSFWSLVGTFGKLVMKSYFLTHTGKIGKFWILLIRITIQLLGVSVRYTNTRKNVWSPGNLHQVQRLN
jgi:lipid-A-disaccharide synthase-like uncharacterized protein